MDRLQIGAAPDDLTRVAALLLEQDIDRAPNQAGVEGALLGLEQRLQAPKALILHRFVHLARHGGGGRPRAAGVFE